MDILETFSQDTIYLVLAAVGSTLFLIKLVLLFVGGDADGGHAHGDASHGDIADGDGGDVHSDDGHTDSGSNFQLLSVQSVLAFMMGSGWMGLACRREWELGTLPSLAIAAGWGFVMMVLVAYLTLSMRKLNKVAGYDVRNAIGATGRVYLTIPEKGAGRGQVEVTVDGRRMILDAASNDQKLDAFTDVRVVEVKDGETLVVEPAS